MGESEKARSVWAEGREITFVFQRKKVKNLNLRVRSDGSVAVSAPPRVPLTAVDDFVRSRAALIWRAQSRIQKETPPPRRYVTGETVWYLGRALELEVREGRSAGGVIEGEHLRLTVPPGADEAARKRAFDRFWSRQCLLVFGQLAERLYPAFQAMGVERVPLRVRAMRSRWGSCHTGKRTITLSCQLIERPVAAIEYVICHEYCHLLQADHSPAFYGLVERVMPDWRQRRALLRFENGDVAADFRAENELRGWP